MGEKTLPSREEIENGFSNEDENESNEDFDDNEVDSDDIASEEFQAINNQLDALNSALDHIEQKNDDIHAQLLQLLQSNREIRKQMQGSQHVDKPEADV